MRAVICLIFLLGTVISYCPNACNKHGVCELDSTCRCFDQWSGADCAERACPSGPEWGGDHVKFSVCSGRGECDRKTGNCQCNEGFSGKACQVMQCPKGDSPTTSCNGHGTCISEGNLLHHYVHPDGSPLEETYGWGKNRIYGCMCVGQYTGHDCTLQICPMGAVEYKDHWDAVSFFKVPKAEGKTTSPSVQISIINCDLPDNQQQPKGKEICRQYTVKAHISYTASQLRSMIKSTGIVYDLVIRYLSKEDDAKSIMPKDTQLKDATIVEFDFVIEPTAKVNKIWYGSEDDFIARVDSNVIEIESEPLDPSFDRIQPTYKHCISNYTIVDKTKQAIEPTTTPLLCRMKKYHKKIYKICSGNGECNFQTGQCQCLITREGDDRYITDNFRFPSDQVDPTVYNCQVKVASESHVNTCNGHGKMIRPEPGNTLNETNMHQYCQCYDGFTGPTCNLHDCSDRRGRSWFNPAGHIAGSICSNMGKCNMKEGVCECSPGYYGNDCSQLSCPSTVAGVDCSGHGICQPRFTNITYEQEWDFLSTSECKCHDGYYGASCSELSCPSGPDPMRKSDSGVPPHISIQYNTNLTKLSTFTIEYAGISAEIQVTDTIYALYNKLMSINGLKPTVTIHDCGKNAKEAEVKEMCSIIDVSKDNENIKVNNGNLYRIYFHYYCGDELDYLPQIENLAGKGLKVTPPSISVNDPVNGYVTKGTIPCYECSNHGYCDHSTGLCKCVVPWGSSKNYDEKKEIDAGTRGDCSYFKKYVGALPEYQVQPTVPAERYEPPKFEAPKVVDPLKYSKQQQVNVPYPQKPLPPQPPQKY